LQLAWLQIEVRINVTSTTALLCGAKKLTYRCLEQGKPKKNPPTLVSDQTDTLFRVCLAKSLWLRLAYNNDNIIFG